LSNSLECQATEHCSTQVWSQQVIQKKTNDNICQFCEHTIDKLRSIITESKIEINVKQWLDGMCTMLQNQNAVDQCKQFASEYADQILDLLKNNINSGVICHLGSMCQDATITSQNIQMNEQSKMLCNVIVRATHDLYADALKSQDEIEQYLKSDCQQLATDDLKQKCTDIIEYHADNIYENVKAKMELSTICDQTVFQSNSGDRCDLCRFVISSAQTMLEDKNSEEDDVLKYIDNQFCSKLNGNQKANCQSMLDTYREILLGQIRQGKKIDFNLHLFSTLY